MPEFPAMKLKAQVRSKLDCSNKDLQHLRETANGMQGGVHVVLGQRNMQQRKDLRK